MDRHDLKDVSPEELAEAHKKDVETQAKFGVNYITYWHDYDRGCAFCLVDAPDEETAVHVHREAHGNLANKIIEVDYAVVEAFLGKIQVPLPVTDPQSQEAHPPIEKAFRAIMFTDMKDSTAMTEHFGESKAMNILRTHNGMIRAALRRRNGSEVKHTGDGIMASFTSVPQSVECAVEIQRGFFDYNREHPDEEIHVRVGLHAGEPVAESNDLYGGAVQLAARICDFAEPDRILASADIKENSGDGQHALKALDGVTFKGFSQPVDLYEIDWRADA
jgi:class 3 adenylate cyclase